MSPSRYREVVLPLQQTSAEKRRPTTRDTKIGRRHQDDRPKSTASPSRQSSRSQQHRGPAAGQHPYRSGTGGRGHPGEGAPACPHMAPPRLPIGQARALPAEGSPPPKEGGHPFHGRRQRVIPQRRGRRHESRPAISRQGASAPKKEGTVGQLSAWAQGRGKVCLHRSSPASQQAAATVIAAAARRDPSRSRPAPTWPRRGSWDL